MTVEKPTTKNCLRCAKRCRVVATTKPNANYFVKGTYETGKYCAECLIVDFFKNFDLGPSSALGAEFFDHSLPQPAWRKDGRELGGVGDRDRRFDPECLRLPHIQEQLTRIIVVAAREHGAELTPEEIDWDEVIANWHLPFPEKPRKGRRHK